MQRLFEFVVRYRNYITLALLVVISFSLMSVGELSRLGGFRAVVVGSIGWMQSVFAWVPNPVALQSENTALRELNLQLSIESARYRQAMVENATLRSMLELFPHTDYSMIAADVVGKTTAELRNFATINRGSVHGVEMGMPCITDAGLVGIVVGTSENYAVIRLLENRDTRIAARVHRSSVDGIVHWQGDAFLSLKDVPKNADVKAGDVVVSSRFSTRFPANIVIGTVAFVADVENSVFQRILVRPMADASTLSQVFVVRWQPDPERVALEDRVVQRPTDRGQAGGGR